MDILRSFYESHYFSTVHFALIAYYRNRFEGKQRPVATRQAGQLSA